MTDAIVWGDPPVRPVGMTAAIVWGDPPVRPVGMTAVIVLGDTPSRPVGMIDAIVLGDPVGRPYDRNSFIAGSAFPSKSKSAWFSHWSPESGLAGSQPLPFTAVQVGSQ